MKLLRNTGNYTQIWRRGGLSQASAHPTGNIFPKMGNMFPLPVCPHVIPAVSARPLLTPTAHVLILFSWLTKGKTSRESFTRSTCSNACAHECNGLWGTSSAFHSRVDTLLRELANPNLHDLPLALPFRVEVWDRTDQHVRLVVAASASVAIGHAAFDAALAAYPGQRLRLRNRIQVIRDHVPPPNE